MADIRTEPTQERGYTTVMLMYTAVVFVAVFPVFLIVTLASAIMVSLYRGSHFVHWRAPHRCMGLLHWAAFEWDYNGLGGRQIGIRALGLEVSYSGMLH